MVTKKPKTSDLPPVSDSELRVLEELWRNGDQSATQIRKVVADDGIDWAFTTLQTFLHRLHEKGYVHRRREGRSWIYSARLQRDEVFRRLTSGLASRLGALQSSSLVLGLLGDGTFDQSEIDRLRDALDTAEAKLRESDGEGSEE